MTYDITTDPYFINFIKSKTELTDLSKTNYQRVLNKFVQSINTPLEQVIINCKEQQDKIIEKIISHASEEDGTQIIEKRIISFDVNDPNSKIKQYYEQFINFCKESGNSNTTINQNMTLINTVLRFYNIKLPALETLKNDAKKWHLLTKEDFKYIINDSPLIHASLIKFLQSSGMRKSDALSLKLGILWKLQRIIMILLMLMSLLTMLLKT